MLQRCSSRGRASAGSTSARAAGLALRLARGGAAVVGVDIAEDGLEHARVAAREEGVSMTFRYGDAHELPFADGELDGVASAFSVIFAPDRERAASSSRGSAAPAASWD